MVAYRVKSEVTCTPILQTTKIAKYFFDWKYEKLKSKKALKRISANFIEYLNKTKTKIHEEVIYLNTEKAGTQLEIAMQWNDGWG